jgi:hypothetical protein
MQYDLGHNYVMSVGYQGSMSRNIFFHQNPLAVPATKGFALNPQIGGGDFWGVNGHANYNALLAEVKHQFSHQFSADVQYTWARSMDTSSAPYSEQYYPYSPNLSYGRSDYNVTNAFKAFGSWSPILFHGNGALERIAGGWTLSGIFNWHSGFPYSPNINVGDITGTNGSLYCGDCGYTQVYPAAYLGGAGTSTSNDAFKGPVSANFPNGASTYFTLPNVPLFTCPTPTTCESGTQLPTSPGFGRNSLTLPGYRSLDLTLSKAFGLPKMPVLGESARFELRLDAYNVFNNLNLDPNRVSNNIFASDFGTIPAALAARVVTVGARFSF